MPSQMAASSSKRSKSVVEPPKDTQKKQSNKGKAKENIFKAIPIPTSGEPLAQSWDEDTPWNWTSLTDPSSSRIPPVFTEDGSYFFSLMGSTIKIYSTATGLVVSALVAPPSNDANNHTDVLTSAVINPQNAFQLITASLGGRLMIWDFVNATLLHTIDLGQPIHYMCVHEKFKGFVYVAASRPRKKGVVTGQDKNAVILQISIKHPDRMSGATEIAPVGKTRFPTGLAISPNGAWLVATAGHKVYVAKTSSLSAGFTKYVSPERLTCLAFHPSEEYFATGDEKGVIRLWYCLNDNLAVNVRGVEKRTQTRAFHWHAHAVSSITFTPNGAYLLSGGEEAVLVIWQLHTGKKEFVPRLGAPVSTVSISRSGNGDEEYLLSLADATHIFISSASLKITRSYSGIKTDPLILQESTLSPPKKIAPIAFQRITSTLILPSSHPSSLQIYSLSTSSLISELEVSPSNRVSRRDDKLIVSSTVEKVVVSESGQWMATIDGREGDSGFCSEISLKIWFWDRKQENWGLNTRIDRPHGRSMITDVSFSPSKVASKAMYLVTTGKDGCIKLWTLLSHRTSQGESSAWALLSTLNFRLEIPGVISWSPDGSLFAVSVGSHIVVYSPLSRSLCQTLTAAECRNIQSVHFIGVEGRYLLAAGAKSLVLWDLIENRVSWHCVTPLEINLIIPHQKDATFAIFHSADINKEDHRTKVSIFRTSTNIPVSIHSLPFELRNAIWASPQNQSGYNLIGVTDSCQIVVIGDSQQSIKDDTARPILFGVQAPKKTLFQDIFGVSAFTINPTAPIQTPLKRKETDGQEIPSHPAYLAPSLDILFDTLAKPFLTASLNEKAAAPENQDDLLDEDVTMEVEMDILASRSLRSPNPGEMDVFIKLFRSHCLTDVSPPASLKAHPKLKGIHERNGTVGRHILAEALFTEPERTPKYHLDHNAVLPQPKSSLAHLGNGKKRKKLSS